MAFKMKAGKKGPMYKNFPGAFKLEGEEEKGLSGDLIKSVVGAISSGKGGMSGGK